MIITAVLLIIIDQITKILAASKLSAGPYVIIPGVLELLYVENHGAAFGLFSGMPVIIMLLGTLFSAVTLILVIRLSKERYFLPLRLAGCALFAGAFGNLIDRILLGYVRDFIYFKLIDFPVFNVADICVVLSVIALILLIFFKYSEEEIKTLGKK